MSVRFNSSNKSSSSSNSLEQICLFNSTRRTKVRARVTRSDKNPSSLNSLGREEYVQSCSNLELNIRARVQFNSTIILFVTTFKSLQVACKNSDECEVIFTKSNLIYWSRYWLFDVFRLINIEIYLYFTFLQAELFLNRNCFIYWSNSYRSWYEFVENSFVEFLFEISCSFSILFAKDLNMIIFVELTRLIEELARFVELFDLMWLWSCQWLNKTYSYSKRERNMIFFLRIIVSIINSRNLLKWKNTFLLIFLLIFFS
jgi:hypothetical protein